MKNLFKARIVSLLGIIAIVAAIGFWFASCDMEDEDEDEALWLWVNQKMYTVTDGVAGSVSYEINPVWKSYADSRNYSCAYSYTIPVNNVTSSTSYVMTQTGSWQISYQYSRNGNTSQSVSQQQYNYTTTISYTNGTTNTTPYDYNATSTSTTVYHEESGLTQSTTSTTTGTSNGNPIDQTNSTTYTIEPQNTNADGSKTYRSTASGSTTGYTEYRIKNGVTLETRSYNASGELTSTTVYTEADSAVIRAKLPDFMLANNNTAEVMSDSATELTVRIKSYNTERVLTSQYDTTYRPRSAISFQP